MFIGALEENIITNEHLIASHTYFHDVLTWCVQQNQPIPVWKNIFRLCNDPFVWALVALMCFLCVSIAYVILQFEDVERKWDWNRILIYSICSVCGFVADFRPKSSIVRTFILYCVFANMIYGITFIAFFINILTNFIYEHQIKTIKELNEKSFKLAGDDFAYHHLMKQNEVSTHRFVNFYSNCSYYLMLS